MTKEELLALKLHDIDPCYWKNIKSHWNAVAKPLDGLGRLETAFCSIGAAQKTDEPRLNPRAIIVMCADNGIVEECVSQSGQEVTLAVARNMGQRKSSVCKMAQIANCETIPVDIGINSDEEVPNVLSKKIAKGTKNFLKEPAMNEEEVLSAIKVGMDLVKDCAEKGFCILATGEMGIGNTTTSTAVAAMLLGRNAIELVGRGAGLDDTGLSRKTQVIEQAVNKYSRFDLRKNDSREEALRILQCVGGLDIAGLCGVFMGGALYNVPIIIDGVISAAAALCAERLLPGASKYMLASHCGKEPAMRYLLDELGLKEIIQAELALGEGTGAVMLLPLLDMAMAVYSESNSFEDIGVTQYERYDTQK